MSVPIEASEDRPGHVGHTPQPVGAIIVRARVEGILSSVLALVMPTEYAMQNYRAPQQWSAASSEATLLRLMDARRRLDPRQPWPAEFLPALEDPQLTRSAR